MKKKNSTSVLLSKSELISLLKLSKTKAIINFPAKLFKNLNFVPTLVNLANKKS